MNRHQKNTYKEGNKMKKSKVTIALVLAGLMLLGTAGMAFASEDETKATLAEQETVVEAAEEEEVSEDGDAAQQFLEIYQRYTCIAPECLNIRTNKTTISTDNIRGTISHGAEVSACKLNDGWAKVNFCGNTCYVAADYLV